MSKDKGKKSPRYETIYDLPYGILNAGLANLAKTLSTSGGGIFRRLADASSSSGDFDYPERVASLLKNNGVQRCFAWEDAYEVTPRSHVRIEQVEEVLGVKFSDEQKLGPLQRIPYYGSTLSNTSGILVPVYPLSLASLVRKFSRFFEDGRRFKENSLLEGFPLGQKMPCRWLIFPRNAREEWISEEELEEICENPLWTRHKRELVPGLTELVYFCILCRLIAGEQARHFIHYYWPVARTCDLAPDGKVVGMTFEKEEKIRLWEAPLYEDVGIGDYPLVKPDVSLSS